MTPETAQLIQPLDVVSGAFAQSWSATPNNVARSRRALVASLHEAQVPEPVIDAVASAVTEVTTNTVFHAYVGRRIGQFQITATVDPHGVAVRVEDDGCGFDGAAPVGHGLVLAASLATRMETNSGPDSGTLTTMWFERAQ